MAKMKLKLKHFCISTCIIWFVIITIIFVVIILHPCIVSVLYNDSHWKNCYMVLVIIECFLVIANINLAIGLYYEVPGFMMIWQLLHMVAWIAHAVVLCVSLITSLADLGEKEPQAQSVIRNIILIFMQVIWLVMICNILSYWYIISEDIYDYEEADPTKSYPYSVAWKSRRRYRASNVDVSNTTGTPTISLSPITY